VSGRWNAIMTKRAFSKLLLFFGLYEAVSIVALLQVISIYRETHAGISLFFTWFAVFMVLMPFVSMARWWLFRARATPPDEK